jgi:hypothetical protein
MLATNSCLHHTLHPHRPCNVPSTTQLEVEIIVLPNRSLQFTYLLSGELTYFKIPDKTAPQRADNLWRHTCFEAFIRAHKSQAYLEFNFSPAGQWQAYTFTDYRVGTGLDTATAPDITCQLSSTIMALQATLQPNHLPAGTHLCLGLSAVLESVDGSISYWALQHAPGPADFHHPDTFVLEIDLP